MSEEIEKIVKNTERTDFYYKSVSPTLELVRKFVKFICADRDATHGYLHMDRVANIASYIAERESLSEMAIFDVVVIAYLHDVADHKYDKKGELHASLQEFLQTLFPTKWQLYLDIIDRISYSKEVKNGDTDWLETLGEYGIKVRNVVSDADKLEAIGNAGLERCYQYGLSHGKTSAEAKIHVKEHAEEKLLKITDYFMRTGAGRDLAKKLHAEMQYTLNKFY